MEGITSHVKAQEDSFCKRNDSNSCFLYLLLICGPVGFSLLKYNPDVWGLRYPQRRVRALVIYFGRTRSSVTLPSHLWRTGLDNVPRDEFPQSVLNSTHRHGPPPRSARGQWRGGERSVWNGRNYTALLCECWGFDQCGWCERDTTWRWWRAVGHRLTDDTSQSEV